MGQHFSDAGDLGAPTASLNHRHDFQILEDDWSSYKMSKNQGAVGSEAAALRQWNQVVTDDQGAVSEYHYRSSLGVEWQSITNIARDSAGQVTSFKDLGGNVWTKLPKDAQSANELERKGTAWTFAFPDGTPSNRRYYDFGRVTVDSTGLHMSGSDLGSLGLH